MASLMATRARAEMFEPFLLLEGVSLLDRSFVLLDKFIDILPTIYMVLLTMNLNDAKNIFLIPQQCGDRDR